MMTPYIRPKLGVNEIIPMYLIFSLWRELIFNLSRTCKTMEIIESNVLTCLAHREWMEIVVAYPSGSSISDSCLQVCQFCQ